VKHYDYMKGYKATNADMTCRGFKFELGKWYKHEGEIKQCESGFHFCVHPSGPWSYYNDKGTRLFAVEARDVIEEYTPGSDLKVVCHEIRLLSEIIPDGGRNTGYMNTGNRNTGGGNTGDGNTGNMNTGDMNTGYMNTGYMNTGNRNTGGGNTGGGNTGYRNTGYRNTGDGNTGNRNTGGMNTGYMNTGYMNTGNRNTGNRNTGNRNTGDGNTGDGNATNHSAGFFCVKEPKVVSFDKQTKFTHKKFQDKYPEASHLGERLLSDAPFDYKEFSKLPGWTLKKCKALHQRFIDGRRLKK